MKTKKRIVWLRREEIRRTNYVPKPDPVFHLQAAISSFNYNLECGFFAGVFSPAKLRELTQRARNKLRMICLRRSGDDLTIDDVDAWDGYCQKIYHAALA